MGVKGEDSGLKAKRSKQLGAEGVWFMCDSSDVDDLALWEDAGGVVGGGE